jgi:hypothetical protein
MKINNKLSSKYSKIKVKKYLDKTEKFVVEFCKKNGIEYTCSKQRCTHHYNFPNGMVDVQKYENCEMIDLFSNAKPFVHTVVAQTFWKKVCALFHKFLRSGSLYGVAVLLYVGSERSELTNIAKPLW